MCTYSFKMCHCRKPQTCLLNNAGLDATSQLCVATLLLKDKKLTVTKVRYAVCGECFKKRVKLKATERWRVSGQNIEVIDKFSYLEVTLDST